MHALVTGGNGFIGSHLVDRLLADGDHVRVLDRGPERFRPPLEGVDYRTGSVEDPFALAEALQGIEVVYHLASTTVPSTSNLNPVADVESNLVSALNLIDQMSNAGANRIVFLSSGGAIYGNPRRLPVDEDHPTDPISSYGVVKLAIEKYLGMYQHLKGLRPIVVRPSNPYGPRQSTAGVQGAVSTFLYRILTGEQIEIWGDGTVVRDYLYITDLVDLCVRAGRSEQCGVFNAGSGEGHRLLDILRAAEAVSGQEANVRFLPSRQFDVQEVVLDNRRAREGLDWSPEYSLEAGIAEHWKWLCSVH